MKSYINTLADYREAPFEKNVTIRCPEEHIAAQMKHLTRGFKKSVPVQTLEKGDVAMLSLSSELEKFNRPMIPITVGGNLFDEEFEKALVGHSVGESFTVTVQDKPVAVTVKQASRTVFPEPTDEMAVAYAEKHDDFSGVKTVAEYREKVIRKYLDVQIQQAVFDGMDAVLNYVLTHSDWEFDQGEIDEQYKQAMDEIGEQLKENGKTFETLSEDEFYMNFGVKSLKEFENELTKSIEQNIASNLWIMKIHGVNSLDEIKEYPYAFLQEFVESDLNITEEK